MSISLYNYNQLNLLQIIFFLIAIRVTNIVDTPIFVSSGVSMGAAL